MADILTKKQRQQQMKTIKSISKLEKIISSRLWAKGHRYRRNSKDLYGKPDISIKNYKIVIFIDSCFWHYCPLHGRIPKSNIDYWQNKLIKNKERDIEVSRYYRDSGWAIKRIWEHDINNDLEEVIHSLSEFINENKSKSIV